MLKAQTHTDTHTNTHTNTHRERQRDRERETETERESKEKPSSYCPLPFVCELALFAVTLFLPIISLMIM